MEEIMDKDVIASLVSALIGSITTCLFFYIGIKYERKKTQKLKDDEETDILQYFAVLLKSVISAGKERSVLYSMHSGVIVSDQYMPQSLLIVPDADLMRTLDKLEHKRIFHSYVNRFQHKGKVDEFKTIFVALDTMEMLYNDAQLIQQNYFTVNSADLKRFNDLYEKVVNECFAVMDNLRRTSKFAATNKLLIYLDEFFKNYHASAKNPLSVNFIKNNFVNPLQVELAGKFSNLEEVRPILENCREISLVLYNVSESAKETAFTFNDLSSKLMEAILVLELNTERLFKSFN